MNEISSTQTVPQPVTTGTSGVQQVKTENGTSVSSSTSLQYGGGYFVMPSLVSMGLLTPTGPQDLEAYWLELTARIEESLAEVDLYSKKARSEEALSLLGRYEYLFGAGAELEAQISEKELKIDSANGELHSLRSYRDELLEDRSKLDTKIEKANSDSERSNLIAERNQVDEKLSETYESMATVQGEISTLTAEVDDLANTLSQIDTAFVVLLTAIVRDRTEVDNDPQSSDINRIERTNEQLAQIRNHAIELNLSEYNSQQHLDSLKELEVQFVEDRELIFHLALTSMQIIKDRLPPEPNGGVLHELPRHESDNGGRYRMPI